MVTISNVVKKIISEKPILQEYLSRNLINYTSLAESMKPDIERQLGKKAEIPAIMMAIRRHCESLSDNHSRIWKAEPGSEILTKSNIVDITVRRSPNLFGKLIPLYSAVKYEEGDTLNVVHGNYEASIITSGHYLEKFLAALKGEKILKVDKDLVSISLRFSEKFRSTPGIMAAVTSKLAFDHINLLEIVSTNTELALIVTSKDAMRAYSALEGFTRT